MKFVIYFIVLILLSSPLFGKDSFRKELLSGLISKDKIESDKAFNSIIESLEKGLTTDEANSIVLFLSENVNLIKSDTISEIFCHFNNEEHPLTDLIFFDCLFNSYLKFKKDSQVVIFHLVLQFEDEKLDEQFIRFLEAYGKELLYLNPYLVRYSFQDIKSVSRSLIKCLSNEKIKYSIYQNIFDFLQTELIEPQDLDGLGQILINDLNIICDTYKIESNRKKKNLILILNLVNFLKTKINEKITDKIFSKNDEDVTLAMAEVFFNQDIVLPKPIIKKLISSDLFKIYLFSLCEKYQKHTHLIDKTMTQEDIARGKLMCWFYETMQMKVPKQDILFNGFHKIEVEKPDSMALFKCIINFPFIKEIVPIAASGGIFKDTKDFSFLERKSVGSDYIPWIGQTPNNHMQYLKDGPTLGVDDIFNLSSNGQSEEEPDQYQEVLLSASFGQIFLLNIKSKIEEIFENTGVLLEEDGEIFETIFEDNGRVSVKYPIVKKGGQYIREGQFNINLFNLDLIATGRFDNGFLNGELALNLLESSLKLVLEFNHNEFKNIQLFENQKLKANLSFLNQLLNGPIIITNDSGNKICEDNYIKGKRHGKSNEYYDNGKIKKTITFKNGEPASDLIKYDEEGKILLKFQFDKNWSGPGFIYYPNGELKQKFFFKNQMLHGPVEEYFILGNIKATFNFKDALLEGIAYIFYENGKTKSKTIYVKGQRQGEEQHFFDSGKLQFIINYVDDLMEGPGFVYNEEGVILCKGEFRKNEAHGASFQYNKESELIAQCVYEKGKIKNGSCFNEFTLELFEYKDFNLKRRSICDENGKVEKEVELFDEKTLSLLKKDIKEGNTDNIKNLNDEYPSILNSDLGDGQNSLHLACTIKEDLTEVVEFLIELETDVNHQDNLGNTPLHYALQNGHDSLINVILSNGAQLNLENKAGLSVIEALLNVPKIQPDTYINDSVYKIQLKNGQNLLHLAAKCNQLDLINTCIKSGFDINLKDLSGNTALSLALFNDKKISGDLLISLGAIISPYDSVCLDDLAKTTKEIVSSSTTLNKPDGLGNTLLHYSIMKGKKEIFDYLVTNKAILTLKNNIGLDPISLTIIHNQPHMFDQLASTGLDIQEEFGEKRYALYYMVKNGMETLLKKYVEKGFPLKIATASEPNLLFVAIAYNQEKLIPYLIEKGLDINELNQNKESCIQISLKNKNNHLFQLFLKHGAKVDLKDAIKNGNLTLIKKSFQEFIGVGYPLYNNNYLHLAIESGQMETVKFLIEQGVSINVKNEENITPLHLSLKLKNEKIAEYLISKGAKIADSTENRLGEIWYLASENGFTKILNSIIQEGYELNSPNANEMIADFVSKGYLEVVKLILKSVDFIYPEKLHDQLIKIAEKNKDEKMIQILNSKPAFSQYEGETDVELNGIYEAKPDNKKIKHGKFKTFNSDGELLMSGSYQNNLLEGQVFELLPVKHSISKYTISNYEKGELDGLKTTYYTIKRKGNSPIKSQEFYKNGKLNGVCSYYEISSKKVMEITYENGLKNGNLKEWIYEKDLISDLEFKNDKIWQGFSILQENGDLKKKVLDFENPNEYFNDSIKHSRNATKWEFENGTMKTKKPIILPKNISNVVHSGLDWLASAQENSGCWDPGGYEGKSSELMKIACTAFSLLSFLGSGHTDRVGKFKQHVKKGIAWLISVQKSDGSFTKDNSINGICTMAIAEAAGMGCGGSEVKLATENACKFILLQQNTSGGFSVFGKSEKAEPGEYDKMPPTVFCIMGLKSAILAGIQEKEIRACFEKTNDLFNKLPTTGDTGENSKGQAWFHAGVDNKENGNESTYQGMALLARQYMGHVRYEPWLKAASKELSFKLPKDINSINYLQGYFQFLALFQQGGEDYNRWHKVYSDLLLQAQTEEEKFFCSWPKIPSGQFADGGRIMSTSLALLALEIHYRYESVWKWRLEE